VILERIRILALDPEILKRLVKETNHRLRTELPKLEEQKINLERILADVQADAEGLLKHMTQGDGALFVAEKLDALADRRPAT